jgi:hypothetical protein
MRTREISANASQREGIQQRFERWRRTRKRCSRIPEDLWSSALEMAREQGLNRTARELRLNYYALKKRLVSVGGPPCEAPSKATFVELLPQGTSGLSVCTIEMENAQGGKMKIQLQSPGAPDLSVLSNNFWRVVS